MSRVDKGYVYEYTKGRVPRFDMLMKLCEDLRVSPGWLLLGDAALAVPERTGRDMPRVKAEEPVAIEEPVSPKEVIAATKRQRGR